MLEMNLEQCGRWVGGGETGDQRVGRLVSDPGRDPAILSFYPEEYVSGKDGVSGFAVLFIFLNIFIDYAITVVPFLPPSLHSILPTPSLPHFPP